MLWKPRQASAIWAFGSCAPLPSVDNSQINLIFFAIIIFIRILQIFYKYSIYSLFTAYLQEIAILVLTRGRAFAHSVEFWMNCSAPPWGFLQLFQKKMANAQH